MAHPLTPAHRTTGTAPPDQQAPGRIRTVLLVVATALLASGLAATTGMFWCLTITATPTTSSSLRTTTTLAAASATVSTATLTLSAIALLTAGRRTGQPRAATTAAIIAGLHLAAALITIGVLTLTSQDVLIGLLPVTLATTALLQVIIVRTHTGRYPATRMAHLPTHSPTPPHPTCRSGDPGSTIRRGSWWDLLP